MKNSILKDLQDALDKIQEAIDSSLDRDEVAMLKRAKTEAIASLVTITYIYQ